MDKTVSALQQAAGLVDAYVAEELAPHVPPDVFRKGVGKPDALKQINHGSQVLFDASVPDAEGKFPMILAYRTVTVLAGVHLAGDAVHDLVGAEPGGEILLAADPVEYRQNDGIRPDQMGRFIHCLRQGAVLDGVQDQLRRPRFGSGITEGKVAGAAVEEDALPTVSAGSGGVGQNADVLLSQSKREIAGIHGAKGAETDDVYGGNGFHGSPSLC